MKCQSLFCGINKKNINLLSAEFPRVVMVESLFYIRIALCVYHEVSILTISITIHYHHKKYHDMIMI